MAVDTVEPKAETTEFQGPVSSYQVIEAKPTASDTRFIAADLHAEVDGIPAVPVQSVAISAPARKRRASRADRVETTNAEEASNKTSTKMVVALGVGLGLLGALAVVAFVLLPGKPADTSYDMGSVTSTATGLKGHLVTNWGDRLDYKLTIEPTDPSQMDAFVTTVNNPPQPIALNLQLKDVGGTVLCNTPIIMKFDPLRNIPNAATSNPSPNGAKKNAKFEEETAQNQAAIDQSLNNARLVSQELSREHGKDVFQPVNGDDGQVASLAAQGTLPCSKKQYESAASWAFTTNFPSVLQPAGPGGAEADDVAFSGGFARNSSGSFVQRRVKRKVPLPTSHFSVEEDDSLVGYQAATGIVETRAGKSFLVERRDLVASSLKGVELPIPIHYRCDQMGACALAGLNNGIQRAWLER
jgi:hypothetical protein